MARRRLRGLVILRGAHLADAVDVAAAGRGVVRPDPRIFACFLCAVWECVTDSLLAFSQVLADRARPPRAGAIIVIIVIIIFIIITIIIIIIIIIIIRLSRRGPACCLSQWSAGGCVRTVSLIIFRFRASPSGPATPGRRSGFCSLADRGR